jgi:hypothetical protein
VDPVPYELGVERRQKIDKLLRFPERLKRMAKEDRQDLQKYFKDKAINEQVNGIYNFKPNIAQAKLLYSLDNEGHMPRTLMLEGSNKVGKTAMLANWGIGMSCGFYPWLTSLDHYYMDFYGYPMWVRIARELGFEGLEEIREKFEKINIPGWPVPNVGLILGETYTESIDKKLVPEFMKWIPKTWTPTPKKNQQGVINKISYKSGPAKGSIIHFRSYRSHPDEFEGIDQHYTGYDEPPPEPIYIAVERGNIVADGRSAFSFTALKEPWIYNLLVNNAAYHWQ